MPQPLPMQPNTPARFRRSTPLKRCPNLSCKREGRCLGLALRGNCMKIFHTDPDGWAGELADKLWAYIEKCRREDPGSIPDEKDIDPNDDSWKTVWKELLEERAASFEAEKARALAKPRASRNTRRKRGRM